MSKIGLLLVLLLGIAIGLVAVEMGVLESEAPGDYACDTALAGDSWQADLNASQDLDNGTRLVCVHENGTRTNVVVNVDVGAQRA